MAHQITTNEIADILRSQAWERAKGELQAMLCTFYSDPKFDTLSQLIDRFTRNVELDSLHQ
jgi:hypothetical protein